MIINFHFLQHSLLEHGDLISYKNFVTFYHYSNIPMQYTVISHGCNNDNFQLIFFYYYHIFAQNIDCGLTLEPPQ